MASESTVNVHDLRSAAVDYQRDRNNKSKWALGQFHGPCRQADSNPRPFRWSQKSLAAVKRSDSKFIRKAHLASKRPRLVSDDWYASTSDSSADEEVIEASAAPEPDADITYSFDAVHGPAHGSQVLGQAVEEAVERFENGVTDKLVKEEYEVLDSDGEAVAGKGKGKGKAKEEDDYEFV